MERSKIAETFKREPIWTEGDMGYLSQRHVPDWREAAKILAESVGTDAADLASDDEGLDECCLRWLDDEAERKRVAETAGITLDPDEDYFQECSCDQGEPFWKVEF